MSTPASTRRRRAAHLALVLAGLALACYGVWRLGNPHITCRGVEMRPGDVCHKNDFSAMGTERGQSYEQRLHSVRLSQPVVVAMGVLAMGFGGALLRQDRRVRP